MAQYRIDGQTLTNMANAIRGKTGESAKLTPAAMVAAINSLGSGEQDIVFSLDNGSTVALNQITAITADGKVVKKILLNDSPVWSAPAYKNWLPLAVNLDGTEFVGPNGEDGYKTGYRIGSSGTESAQSGMCCTGYIPVAAGDTIRIKNVTPAGTKSAYVLFYSSTGTLWSAATKYGEQLTADSNGVYTLSTSQANTAYMRLSFGVIDGTSIITINEEIT